MGIKRTKYGWRVDWRDEYGRRKRLTFDSRDAADHFLTQERAKVQTIQAKGLPQRITLGEYAETWLKKVQRECEGRNKPRTAEWYKNIVTRHLLPILGQYNLSDLSPAILRGSPSESGIRERLADKGLATKTLRSYLTCLGTILKDAYRLELVDKDLSLFLEKPKVVPRMDNKRPLTLDEISLFFETCPQEHHLYFSIGFFSGMRPGEIMALKFGDFDLLNNKIHVERSLNRDGSFTTTKTGKSRLIDITPHLRPFLNSWRHLKDVQSDRVFPDYHGTHIKNRTWARTLRKMKIAYRKPYVTRHTFASLMLSEGQPPAWVANMMGDNLETVLRSYAQWIPTDYKTTLMRPVFSRFDGHFLDTPKMAIAVGGGDDYENKAVLGYLRDRPTAGHLALNQGI